ncbi:hypothetical protein M758_7G127800 [Ceratodon purpureus]|uniref:Uncharacterized protein n=1 Tax=Ceratodon purpureus TaxID=3225 RepID=A0A8T0HBB2_CERPU|nr:hypothetical protein KC19_7G149300 [Ceratodon purpureus]KAG0611269.1 hypothetical protein M758_7G127800 [Ceratodon purpureus]
MRAGILYKYVKPKPLKEVGLLCTVQSPKPMWLILSCLLCVVIGFIASLIDVQIYFSCSGICQAVLKVLYEMYVHAMENCDLTQKQVSVREGIFPFQNGL